MIIAERRIDGQFNNQRRFVWEGSPLQPTSDREAGGLRGEGRRGAVRGEEGREGA